MSQQVNHISQLQQAEILLPSLSIKLASTDCVNEVKLNTENVNVLLIDDQKIIGEAINRIIANEADIIFNYLSDSTQAIQKAIAIEPTVILLDLIMPDMDGLMLLRWFRSHPSTRDIPIIMLSSKEEAKLKAEAFAEGANDYLIKLPDAIELIARIRARMDVEMRAAGWTGDFAGFLNFLRTDPQFYATSREQLLEKASEMSKRADDGLPALFGVLPRTPYGVRPVPLEIEATYTTGRYFPGSLKGGVAGGYIVNTGKLDQRPLYELPALTLHEAVPGHHLQIALQQEAEAQPYFRRAADVTAFTEGWACTPNSWARRWASTARPMSASAA
jgi:DNA-binding response OmpR family regulator